MADLALWKNEQLRQLKDEMDRMVEELWRDFGHPVFDEIEGAMVMPDIRETAERIVITAELPDIEPGDLEVEVSPDYLVLSGRKKESATGAEGRVERSHRFSSRIKLPCKVDPDSVEAIQKNHSLEITLPKCRLTRYKKITVHRTKK